MTNTEQMFYNTYTLKIGSDKMDNNNNTNTKEEKSLVNYNVEEIENLIYTIR